MDPFRPNLPTSQLPRQTPRLRSSPFLDRQPERVLLASQQDGTSDRRQYFEGACRELLSIDGRGE